MQSASGSWVADALWSPRRRFVCARGRNAAPVRARRGQQQLQIAPPGSSSSTSDRGGDSFQYPTAPAPAASPRPDGTAPGTKRPLRAAPSSVHQIRRPRAVINSLRDEDDKPANTDIKDEKQQQEQELEQEATGEKVTQTIFRLERRGEGWGEEIFPTITVEQREVSKSKRRYSTPDPWQKGSLEEYLVECGVPPGDVDRMVTQAVAWRFTAGGRPLIDRRRRLRVERNVRMVVEYLELHCGVLFGPKGIAAIFARVPEIMLCKPSTNDRWDRRAVELAAYLHRFGHANVPEDWEENPELGQWVKRQRVARAAGQLSEERLAILASMGFEFGEVAQLTDDWEHRFDQLIDWILWHNENSQHFSWVGYDWGARGGLTARELALWITLQREYRRRGLLPVEALRRFDALHVQWEPLDRTPSERAWMAWLGRLLYVVERHNAVLRSQVVKGTKLGRRPKLSRSNANSTGGGLGGDAGGADSEEEEDVPRLPRRGSAAVAAARARLQQEVFARRAALSAADLRCEPGLRLWLAKQRCLWRRRELPAEQVLMLQLAGADMDTYSPVEWQALAHAAAAFLQGSEITLGQQAASNSESSNGGSSSKAGEEDGASSVVATRSLRGQGSSAAVAALAVAQAEAGLQTSVGSESSSSSGSTERLPTSPRLRVLRWVQAQQALLAEGRLSEAQLRYMTFLGITWVLSDEVLHMADAAWQALFDQLVVARAAGGPLPDSIQEWLRHQHGLAALGCLAPQRAAQLAAAGEARPLPRSAAERYWDARLSELLVFKGENGHCAVAEGERGENAALAAWLAEQRALLAAGLLQQGRAAQLQAIGVLQDS